MEIEQTCHVLQNVIVFMFILAVAASEPLANGKKMLTFQIAASPGNQICVTTVTSHIVGAVV